MYKNYFKILFLSVLMMFTVQTVAANAKSTVSDSVITGKIKSKIAVDPTLSIFKVKVYTQRGIVYLTARLNSETEADALIELAQATDGVKDVNTGHLLVNGSTKPLADTSITAKIKGLFIRGKLMGREIAPIGVHVETNNGVVYLSGTVDNQEQADNAVQLAKSVNGVKKVLSRIEVQ